jgi:hypothetical protein
LTRFARGREVGGVRVSQGILPVRLKAFGPGSEVRLKDCVSYPLPRPFEEGELVKVVSRDTGSVVIERDGLQYWVPLTNIDPGCDLWLNGVWLDQWDRRVRKAQARIDAMRERQERLKAERVLRYRSADSVRDLNGIEAPGR